MSTDSETDYSDELDVSDLQSHGSGGGHGWYARKTRETRAFLGQLRPDETGRMPGYDQSRRWRRRRGSRRSSSWSSRLWRRMRDWIYQITSPLP